MVRLAYYEEMAVVSTVGDKRVCVIMPAYNEAASVGRVVHQVRQHAPLAHIVVINDGSSDGTEQEARRAGAQVITLPFNLGIGGAVQTGLKYARREGFDVAVEIDADGQHDPVYIPQLVDSVLQPETDMVIGSRFATQTMYRASWLRWLGIRILSQLRKLVTGARIYDATSGYRAYHKRSLPFLAGRYPADFPEPESIVMLLNAGFRIQELPMAMNHRVSGESVVGKSDLSWRGAYFVLSNAIAILVSGLKEKRRYVS